MQLFYRRKRVHNQIKPGAIDAYYFINKAVSIVASALSCLALAKEAWHWIKWHSQKARQIEPLSAHHRNAIRMAFRWRADSDPRFDAGRVLFSAVEWYEVK